ncbi:hypothetical protein LSTR_LSTR003099 [Laodelphax striatellus]|uniref:Uncharacterized protein n=1 Tax=Laodelphax striatellus TaxID=195883 RepID=A0A482WW41_LAOST|nr:hypothetical protein LSTR_LSTR003099 [Laodelphax striatellus]
MQRLFPSHGWDLAICIPGMRGSQCFLGLLFEHTYAFLRHGYCPTHFHPKLNVRLLIDTSTTIDLRPRSILSSTIALLAACASESEVRLAAGPRPRVCEKRGKKGRQEA